jgi:hypothetical protein
MIARGVRCRLTAVVGMLLAAGGLAWLAALGLEPADAALVAALVVVGLGLGTALCSFVLAAQNAAPADRTGVATGLSTTARAVGGSLASAVFGAVLSAGLGSASQTASSAAVLASALQDTFVAASAFVLLGGVLTVFLDDRLASSRVGERVPGTLRNPQRASSSNADPSSRPASVS